MILVRSACLSPYEHCDGTGYPDGLAGRRIPLGARILAIADAFDAMTSSRLYRTAMTPQQALEILRRGAGTQWDAEIVRTLTDDDCLPRILPHIDD